MKLPSKKKSINEDVPLISQLRFIPHPICDNRLTPTHAEIRSMTFEIQETWDAATERSRRSSVTLKEDDDAGWNVPLVPDLRSISSQS